MARDAVLELEPLLEHVLLQGKADFTYLRVHPWGFATMAPCPPGSEPSLSHAEAMLYSLGLSTAKHSIFLFLAGVPCPLRFKLNWQPASLGSWALTHWNSCVPGAETNTVSCPPGTSGFWHTRAVMPSSAWVDPALCHLGDSRPWNMGTVIPLLSQPTWCLILYDLTPLVHQNSHTPSAQAIMAHHLLWSLNWPV